MDTRTREVLDMALRLPPAEQEELLAELAAELGAGDESSEQAWIEEATRRWSNIAAGEAETIPWSEVRQALTRRFGV